MKKHRFSLTLAVAACLSTACTDSFFDLEPSDNVTTDKVYKTAEDFDIAVIGCYSKLQTQVSFFTELCEYRSDNLYLSAPTTGTQDRYDIDRFADKPSNGILQDAWANFNNGVYRCNLVLDKIDSADFDESLKKQYKAEALFIRALTYFNMYRFWGGIPMTDKVVTIAEALKIGRSSKQQVYDFLTRDLTLIITNNMLPQSYTGENTGRITMGAAKALLGKVHLTFHQWEAARDVLSQIIGKYALMKTPEEVFSVDNKMNDEIIFAVRFNKDIEGEGHGFWFSIANLTDNNNQTQSLKGCYTDDDKRKKLIEYVKVENRVCLMNKFKDTRNTTYNTVGNDQIILRYADVLLMYAEALNEIGYSSSQTSAAMTALNAVHTRSCNSAIQITELPDKERFRKAIMLERQREFPYEGQRWFDLIRMGGVQEAMKAEGHEIKEYQYLYPIPKTELERVNNEQLLWQNPEY